MSLSIQIRPVSFKQALPEQNEGEFYSAHRSAKLLQALQLQTAYIQTLKGLRRGPSDNRILTTSV